ncbi:MAG: glycoside hydrolase family 16 protein [Anaerolineales bacterium]|nr:glycoside hydrolase family 16 protein [Anaerolineales bacterium]
MKLANLALGFAVLFSATACLSQAVSPSAASDTVDSSSPTQAPTKISSPATDSTPLDAPSNVLFDDFDYAAREEMTENGWIIRGKAGWPGVPGASFRPENVSFLDDAEIPNNRLLRMTSSTDGSSANTFQTQVCHQRKYLEGTYAARVYFNNTPVSGPDGDQMVETFYAITPYEEPMKPEYSEMDFEYLPNGGWGFDPMTFMFTTWETAQIEPWQAENASDSLAEDVEGWRTLVLQVGDGVVRYYIDGKLNAEHGGNYYPEARMSINFNLWFINGGLIDSSEARSYEEDIDWVYHEAGAILSPEQVNEKALALREAGISFVDTVPAGSPALDSLCDL